MSRLIVKNLPKNVTDTQLKELFSQKGLVTDVQLKYTKDGKFRRFGFIGFKTDAEAEAAKSYFDQTCIETCRISVEQCTGLGDPSKPRSWSKYAPDSSHNKKHDAETKEDKDVGVDKDKSKKDKSKKDKEKKKEKNKEKDKEKSEKSAVLKDALEKYKDDPLFLEFLETHGATGKTAWSNDLELPFDVGKKSDEEESEESDLEEENQVDTESEKEDEKEKIANKVISDLEYMESLKKKKDETTEPEKIVETKTNKHGPLKLFTVKVRGLAYNHKKKHVKQLFKPLKAKSIRLSPKIKGIAFVGFKTSIHMKKALMKHKSFLDGKQIYVTQYEEKENLKTKEDTDNNSKWKKQEEALKDGESIAESGRMFIRNLSYTTTEDDIQKLFEKYGPLSEVNLPVDKYTRKLKGFGTVTFVMPEHAAKAYSELDGSILNGRMLHLLPGKVKESPLDQLDQEGLTYKQKKELKDKATASSTHNWNTLFLGQNAVAEAIAATYNTTKEKVLEDGTKNMTAAVKLALGETQLVQNTRVFLEENDVRLDAFNQPPEKRSKTVILVKNLPAATPVKEIRDMFAKFGELGRVVMPPSGITALVEFLEPSEARKAFTKLAYTKFRHLPLYLEWAPDNTFTKAAKEASSKKTSSDGQSEVLEKSTNEGGEKGDNFAKPEAKTQENDEDDDEPEPDTTLFVKNVNFATTDEQLREYFAKCGAIHYATIATKKDPKNPGGKLSMGYGFVRYKYKSDADRALKSLQMSVLDGKTLELKRSERTLATDEKTTKKQTKTSLPASTKILVRNVPFQATVGEITELFKAFGELKAVRLPKKLVGVEKHRGFGFVEYYSKSDAKKAFKALCQSTHLYGRRLVLEWAQAEEGIDEIRKRTAKHFYEGTDAKRSKKSVLDPESVGLAAE